MADRSNGDHHNPKNNRPLQKSKKSKKKNRGKKKSFANVDRSVTASNNIRSDASHKYPKDFRLDSKVDDGKQYSVSKSEMHNFRSEEETKRFPKSTDHRSFTSTKEESIKYNTIGYMEHNYGGRPRYQNFNIDRPNGEIFNERVPPSNLDRRMPQANDVVSGLLRDIEHLSNQVNSLTQENQRLIEICGMQRNCYMQSDSEVDIKFKNKDLEQKFLPTLRDIVSDLITGDLSIEKLREFHESSKEKSNQIKDSPDSPDPPDSPEGDLFSLDISTIPVSEANSSVPKYESSFYEILQSEDQKTETSSPAKSSQRKFQKTCFNCSGDHFLYKCPHKINQQKVANARKQTKSSYVPSVRYHAHGSKESEYKPGVISQELRDALGLSKSQIPLYIYRMRILDYPPGWLREAAVESSGITVYGSDGNVETEENWEDGEVDNNERRVQYDPDKLVDYPGFNVSIPPDCVDESLQLGFPPFQLHHLRSVMQQHMAKPNVRPSRKRKPTILENLSSKIQRCEEDMEVEEDLDGGILNEDADNCPAEFIPPLPQSEPPPPDIPPPPPPPDDSGEILLPISSGPDSEEGTCTPMSATFLTRFKIRTFEDPPSGMSSPSLTDLEEMKKRLVMELGISEIQDDMNSNSPLPNDASSQTSNPAQEEILSTQNSSPYDGTFMTIDSSNDQSYVSDCSASSQRGENKPVSESVERTNVRESKSKLVTLGTPSLSRHSSFSKLPDYDRFSKNVTSHLNFENLPNSTGTYEKMKGVLKKVKQKFNSLMH